MTIRGFIFLTCLPGLALTSGCCVYHQRSVADLSSLKTDIPKLYDGFASAPTASERTAEQNIDAEFVKVREREKSYWPWCRQTADAVEASQQMFDDQVANRNRMLPATIPPELIDAYKGQIDRTLTDAIQAIQVRKK